MKKTLNLLSLFFVLSCSNSYAYTKGKTYKLTILHTNDHHGRFWPNKDGELGLAPRATLINQLREEAKIQGSHVLLIDAGDINTGVPQSDLLDAEPDFRGMALLNYDVMVIGNHEFDNSLDTIFKQREWAGFPFISANIYHESNKKRVFPSHIVKELEDLKVTIFGLTTSDTPLKTNPLNTKGLVFVPAVEEAKKLVPILKKDTDVLIALTHMGHYPDESHGSDAPGDVTLARQVDGIDLIVGGHTQKPLFQADIQNGTTIVQAYEWGKYVGKVEFEFLDGKLTLKDYKLIPVNLKTSEVKIQADPYVESILRPYKEQGDVSLQIELGSIDEEFIGRRDVIRFQETNLGNLVGQAYKTKLKTDITVMNSGGIRDSMYAGKVTYETVLMVLPFGGEIVTSQMNGAELKTYLETILFTLTPGTGSFPQLAGVDIVANKEEKKIKSLLINGEKLCLTKTYSLALPEFIAVGGDRFPTIKFTKSGYVDADLLRSYVLDIKDIKARDYAVRNYIRYE